MNRTELAEEVASRTHLDKRKSASAVEAVTDSIVAEIKSGNRVSIFGFGSFEPRARAARTARNQQTQETVRVPASKTVAFKPASAFKETLNSRGKAASAKKTAKKATAKKTTARKTTAKKTTARKAAPAKRTTRVAKKR